jgi:hypothetical protein
MPGSLSGTIDWMGAKKLSLGRHTLTVTAVDSGGNTSSRTVAFTKVRVGAESAANAHKKVARKKATKKKKRKKAAKRKAASRR